MHLTNEKVKELRKQFPLLSRKVHGKSIIYVDNAATTQKPQAVLDAMMRFYTQTNANIHRGVYALSEDATNAYEDARKVVAEFIGAGVKEVVFTRGTTEGLNLLTHSLFGLFNGRTEIVLTEMEHHANIVPWQQLAKRLGMTIKYITVKDYALDYADAEQKITANTAVVSLNHVSNALGTVNDVAKIIALAKKNGALTVLDAAQSVPHMNVDVKQLDCDFLVFSSHKMLGPTGIGVLYGKQELLEKMEPYQTGGDMIRTVSFEEATWNELPMKFEAGTPPIAQAVGLRKAIEFLQSVGLDAIHAWEQELTRYALEKLQELEHIELHRAEHAAGIISFTITGIHPHDVASLLDDEGVCVRGGHHCAMPLMKKLGVPGTSRMSFYLYNTYEDVDAVIAALKKTQQVFA